MISNLNKKAQITIFIIIALMIVAAVVIFFVVRNVFFDQGNIGLDSSAVFEFFDNCIKEKTKQAVSIAGSQGGYIETPEFEAGSLYSPLSNQLDFLGVPVPYWYYISANNVIKEQIPSKTVIERQIGDFLNDELRYCDFNYFRDQGYDINSLSPILSNVKILDKEIRVEVKTNLNLKKGDQTATRNIHKINVQSDFGKFYNLAKEIYDKEKKDAFLELYTQDVLYNYAPITGSDISCSPLIWNAQEVSDSLRSAISANVQALKVDNGKASNKNGKYFTIPIKTSENVNFLYLKDWPSKIEIWPAENNLLIAEPIGLENGLGVLGFCYVPYHFVYDIYHPILIQIYNENEIFQFPISVIIDKSVPRNAILSDEPVEFEYLDSFCANANTEIEVLSFDSSLNPIEASISFECLNQLCNIGQTKVSGSEAKLKALFPQCVNGKAIAKADGYVIANQIFSTNEPGSVNLILDKLYELDLNIVVGGVQVSSTSNNKPLVVVHFVSDKYSTTIAYPQQNKIKLSEGLYNISVQVFSGSSLVIPASSEQNCVQVPKKGLLGFFGGTTEECFIAELPSQTLDNALSAGGKSVELILEDDLKLSRNMKISIPSLPQPLTLDQLQQNYELFEVQKIGVSLG